MSKSSWLPVVDAAYCVDVDSAAWLDGVVQAVALQLDRGLGVCGFTYDASNPEQLRVDPPRFNGLPDEMREFTCRALQAIPLDVVRDSVCSPAACTTSEVLGRQRMQSWFRAAGSGGFADTVVLHAVDPSGRGCLMAAPMPHMSRLGLQRRAALERVAAHLATGHRLRRAVHAAGKSLLDGAEAILDGAGRTAHADGEARTTDARAALRRAAQRIDRARARGADPGEALAIWRALVEGRWSLLDHFDSDGQRFFVAYRNDPRVQLHRRLTEREAQAMGYAALGHSNKLIGYELGLSASTVATHLAEAQRKLGVRGRAGLIAVARALSRGGERAGVGSPK